MAVVLVPRSTWYNRPPHNNDGVTTRPLLRKPVLDGLTIHYTGSPWIARASTDTAQAYMTWMQESAFRQRKSFEYNDIVPPRADGSAQVWEYAGDYQAAHAGSPNNTNWYAIQVAIGVNNHPSYASFDPTRPTAWQPLTDPMIEAIRWRRADLVARGILAANHEVREHRQLPNVATTCPGDAVRARWSQIVAPLAPPLPPEEPPMVRYFKLAPDALTLFATSDGLTAVRLEGWQAIGRGIDIGSIPVLPAAEHDDYVYLAGFTSQSVK